MNGASPPRRTLHRLFPAAIVLAVTFMLSGCAASRKMIRYGDLKTQTQMSESVFLELRTGLPPTVFVSESCSATRDVTIRPALERDLIVAGYEVVSSPDEATYVLQVNHLSLVEVELDDDEDVGDAIGSATAAGLVTGMTADLLGADDEAAALFLAGSLASFIVDAKTVHRAHTLTTDVRVTEALPGGEGLTEHKYHSTRITSGASKVNLDWSESMPHLVHGVSSTLSGLLPDAASR